MKNLHPKRREFLLKILNRKYEGLSQHKDLFQLLFRLDTPQHKIGWSLLSTVITSALAALYFSWDRLVVWWKKPIMEWMVEEKEEEE